MKKSLTISLIVLLMAVAGCKRQAQGGDLGPDGESVRARVIGIYNHVCDIYNRADPAASVDSAAALDRRYLSSEFLRLQEQVARIDSLYYPGEVGFRDYDHWVMGQDWDRVSFTLDTLALEDQSHALASITLTNAGSDMQVDLRLVREGGEWRIADFIGYFPEPGSELQSMKEYVDDENEADTD